ncbi:hypothetical protein QI113_12160 [Staphylococcus saprophyticus]|uniref:hypothetical protein n=1 Tax=Staphylococcus saprophyticus TaxID=29385 RepID=UPI0029793049|nr:hypothetical protein [Staphylococcus saprophyticus]
MSELDNDIKKLEDAVDNIIEIAKKYSIYDFISGGIKITTIRRFVQREKDIFSVSTDTLRKICNRIDELSDNTFSHVYKLNYLLENFVNKNIDVLETKKLVELGISRDTLKRMKNNAKGQPYYLNTLVKYARLVESWRCTSVEKSV